MAWIPFSAVEFMFLTSAVCQALPGAGLVSPRSLSADESLIQETLKNILGVWLHWAGLHLLGSP